MRRIAAALALSAAATVLLAAIGWPAAAYWEGDHVVFWAGSRAVLEGASPYDAAWWSSLPERAGMPPTRLPVATAAGPPITTAYPLWTFLPILPFGAVPYGLAAPAWLVSQVLVVGAALALLASYVLGGRRADAWLLGGIAAAFQPIWILVGNGNVTGFLFGALATGFVLLERGRPFLAGAVLGTLLVKPHPFAVLAVVALVASRSRARIAAGAASTAAVLVIAAFAVRPTWVAEWLPQLAVARPAGLSNATALTLDRAVGLPFVPAVAVGLAVGILLLWWHRSRPRPDALFAAALALSLFASPYGWSYDHLYLLLGVAVVLRYLALVPGIRAAGVVLLAVVAGPLPWILYAAAFARGGEELSALVPASFLVLVVLVDVRVRSRAARPALAPL